MTNNDIANNVNVIVNQSCQRLGTTHEDSVIIEAARQLIINFLCNLNDIAAASTRNPE